MIKSSYTPLGVATTTEPLSSSLTPIALQAYPCLTTMALQAYPWRVSAGEGHQWYRKSADDTESSASSLEDSASVYEIRTPS
jgi:hypothetical protein